MKIIWLRISTRLHRNTRHIFNRSVLARLRTVHFAPQPTSPTTNTMKLSTVPSSFLLTLATVTGSLAAPADNDGLYVRADCTFNAGQTGTCMTTTTCAQQGGTSEAGESTPSYFALSPSFPERNQETRLTRYEFLPRTLPWRSQHPVLHAAAGVPRASHQRSGRRLHQEAGGRVPSELLPGRRAVVHRVLSVILFWVQAVARFPEVQRKAQAEVYGA